MKAVLNFLNDDRGVDLIEYALLAALIGVAAMGALTTLEDGISAKFGAINTAISTP